MTNHSARCCGYQGYRLPTQRVQYNFPPSLTINQGYTNRPRGIYNAFMSPDLIRSQESDPRYQAIFNNWRQQHWGSAYTVNFNARGTENRAAILYNSGDLPYTPYPISSPASLYTNTNAAYIRRLERSNLRGIYNTVIAPRDPARNINLREEGRRIASERFETLYNEGAFRGVDTSDYFVARDQIKRVIAPNSVKSNGVEFKGVGYRDSSGALVTYQVRLSDGATGLYRNGEFTPGVIKVNRQEVAIG